MSNPNTNRRNERNGAHQTIPSRTSTAVLDAAESAESTVVDTLEKGANYLTTQSPDALLNDATDAVRNNPITSVLIGFGLGFLLARILRR